MKGYVAKHNKKHNLKEIEQLTPKGFEHTTTDSWRAFCRHVVDIENQYFNRDGLIEDVVEEVVIEYAADDDDDDSSDEEDLINDHDRRLIDEALQQTSQQPTDISTDPRRDLTSVIQNMDRHFLESVLPLSCTSNCSSD